MTADDNAKKPAGAGNGDDHRSSIVDRGAVHGAAAPDPRLLALDALTKKWPARTRAQPPTTAVDDLTLNVRRGELLTLLGPSGCGKTTTLRLIAGFETPTSGRILLERRDVTRLSPQRRNMGMVFQNYALFPHLDVAENVAFGLKSRGVASQEIGERVERALELVDLPGYGPRPVQALSGGQQQRVALARALAPEPPVLLLDEPLSNLDAALRERTRAELRTLIKRLGITAVFVTHDQEEAFALADRVAVLSHGRLQQMGVPPELYRQPANRFVASFLGRANFLPATIRAIQDDDLVCELDAGVRWHARASAALPPATPGARVDVMVRPESLQVLGPNQEGGEEALRVQLVERRFAGAAIHYRFAAAGIELLVTGEDVGYERFRLRPRPGADVLAFPPHPSSNSNSNSSPER
ncbi:MAG TPA: ABC transporter ATP-binding protein [Longimicrobiales bacterium]|nr:ABC transporter ATP-binding protein [Longimicrobiales bacterium]